MDTLGYKTEGYYETAETIQQKNVRCNKQFGQNQISWNNYLTKNKSAKVHFDDEVLKVIESESYQMDNLSDRLEAMERCIRKLSEKELALLRMRYQNDFSFKKIALKIGISKQSVYRSISRIHAKLVKCIKYALGMGVLYEH